jgi:coproporphyrinogen III oxidase
MRSASQAKPDKQHVKTIDWFAELQQRIIHTLESLEPSATFTQTPWHKNPEDLLQGHGTMAVMRGDVFEKVGVNYSNVHGTFSEQFAGEIPGALENNGAFKACGVSLVAHPTNPFVPIVHMNVRHIETAKSWFGGGADLTPTFPFDEDTALFHHHMKQACDGYDPGAYPAYKKWCDEYFFIKHHNEPRGVGGIFFDDLNSGNFEKDFSFIQAVGQAFIETYPPLVQRRAGQSWTETDKEQQLLKRARYVEFNLLYDRGTRFGFMTGGNPEAILMSMPPTARWP